MCLEFLMKCCRKMDPKREKFATYHSKRQAERAIGY